MEINTNEWLFSEEDEFEIDPIIEGRFFVRFDTKTGEEYLVIAPHESA